MTAILILLGIGFVIWLIYMLKKSTHRLEYDDNHFKQGGVEVVFDKGTITIDKHHYKATQVTGISTEENARGSVAWRAVIEVDDFAKPQHHIIFMSRKKANEFTQRLSVALRKAGGPSFA